MRLDTTHIAGIAYRAAALLLIVAIFPIREYDFYVVLRVVICALAIAGIIHIRRHAKQRHSGKLIAGLAVVALLFNPVLPVHSSKTFWILADSATAGLFWYLANWIPDAKAFLAAIPEAKRDGIVFFAIALFLASLFLFRDDAYPVLLVALVYAIAGIRALFAKKVRANERLDA
jgi:hypothetical protein